MRVFVGIKLSEELVGRILEWIKRFQESSSKYQTNSKNQILNTQIRFIEPKNLHITLVPPWETDDWQIESQKLKVVKFQPFEIRFERMEFGPDQNRPRMIWASGSAGEEIKELKKLIEIGLGKTAESREFRLHCTLARLKTADKSARYNTRLPQSIDWRQEVASFVLYQSHLLPQGADYKALAEFPFSTKYEKGEIRN